MTTRQPRVAHKAAPFRRELVRVPAEMAGVAGGLFLGLARDDRQSAGSVFSFVLCPSAAASFVHYTNPKTYRPAGV